MYQFLEIVKEFVEVVTLIQLGSLSGILKYNCLTLWHNYLGFKVPVWL